MAYQAPGQCPVCDNDLTISKLTCSKCHTSIEGKFESCEFCRLPKEDLHFLKTFIKCRGSIKDVERDMGISYPTVKGKLNNLIQALGFDVTETETKEVISRRAKEKEEIINELEQGTITAKEASELLNKLK